MSPASCGSRRPFSHSTSARFLLSAWLALASARASAADAAAPAAAPDGGSAAPVAAAASASPFENDIRAFEAEDRKGPLPRRPVLFIGSSSIRLWTTLRQDFPRQRVLNRGFGGSHISDSVGFVERIVVPYAPPLVVMYAGGNDIDAGKSPAVVAADFKAFVARVWSHLPRTEIAFISIAPNPARWHEADRVREANRLIGAACQSDARLHFIDVFPLMIGADGQPRADLFVEDRLHMNRKGYELWIPPVRAAIQAILGPGPTR
jgi:lysophospholipase L1-like esterase